MQIIEATIHRLIKEAGTNGQGSVTKQLRDTNLVVDETLNSVCRDLLSLYARSTDSQGTLGDDPNVHVFPVRLREYLDRVLSFQEFTHAAIALIAAQMEGARLSNGGYALFVKYREGQHDFLLIAMLKIKQGAGIDEASLSLEPTLNIDLHLLNEAARVNITRLNAGEEPYLTFIKGARKQTGITEYFRTALACTNFTNSAYHTEQLIRAAEAYVVQRNDLRTEDDKQIERIEMRKRLYDFFKSSPEEITLATAAAHIHPNHIDDFVTFVKGVGEQPNFAIDDTFKPDKKVFRKLKRISSTMGSVRISFDVQDVQSGAVSYDPRQDVVMIRNPVESLKQEILDNAAPTAN